MNAALAKEIADRLTGPYCRLELLADGHKLTASVERISTKAIRYGVVVYVDGWIKGEYSKPESEIGAKFYPLRTRQLYSAKAYADYRKACGKRAEAAFRKQTRIPAPRPLFLHRHGVRAPPAQALPARGDHRTTGDKRMKAKRDDRRIQLGRIHQAQKALGMDDETYRACLERVTGKRSSGQMTPAERNAVLAEFARLGFKRTDTDARGRIYRGRPRNVREVPMLRKVEALLADSKRPWSYAHAMAKRMFHVNLVQWLHDDQLHKLVAALQADANRKLR